MTLYCLDSAMKRFHHPVKESKAPGYHSIIKNPIDFALIKRRLASIGNFKYTTVSQFIEDLNLVFFNCFTYNQVFKSARLLTVDNFLPKFSGGI